MDSKQRLDAIKHIKLGIKEIFYYNYEGSPLPLRPISSFELDDCFYKALRYANEKVFDLVVKLRLSLVDKEKEMETFTNKDYISLQQHYDSLSYWILYYSMKDFQEPEFQKPIFIDNMFLPQGILLVRQMNYVHDMAQHILDASYKPKEMIKEVVTDESGREVAYCVFYLNAPLAELGDMTRLQRDYLLYCKGEMVKMKPFGDDGKKKQYIISGKKMTMADVIQKFYGKDVLDDIKNKFNSRKELEESDNPFAHVKLLDTKKLTGENNANSR